VRLPFSRFIWDGRRLVRDAVFARVPRDQLTQAVAQVADLVGPLDDQYFEDLRTRSSPVRRFLPAPLEQVEFAATDAGRPAIEAVRFLPAIEGQKRPDMSRAPRDLLTPAWQRVVIGAVGREQSPGARRRAPAPASAHHAFMNQKIINGPRKS
jgi:hypothetical protein